MEREPARLAGLVTAVVAALLALLVAVGLPISGSAQELVLGIVAALAPVAAAMWIRRRVTPVADPKSATGKTLVPVNGHSTVP